MDKRYSPGPWVVMRLPLGEDGRMVYIVRSQDGTAIAGVYSGLGMNEAQAEANAQAIAALPDLVAACEYAGTALLTGTPDVTPVIEALAAALGRIHGDRPDLPPEPTIPAA